MNENERYLDSLLAAMMGQNTEADKPEETPAVSDEKIVISEAPKAAETVIKAPEKKTTEIKEPVVVEQAAASVAVSEPVEMYEEEQVIRRTGESVIDRIAETIIEQTSEKATETVSEPEPAEEVQTSDEQDAELTPEKIASMVTEIDAPEESDETTEEVVEDTVEEAAAEEPAAAESAEEPAPIEVTPVSDDPNAKLTPDQIAAMFAQASGGADETAEEKTEETTEETTEEVVENTVEEAAAEETAAAESAEEPAPIEVTPVSDDPNAKLTPDQIAAMFAQASGGADEAAEETTEETTVETAEEVVENTVEEPAEEPAPIEVTPVSDDPNAKLTPDQIAAMLAQASGGADEAAEEKTEE
ncbi:MAG: hypothetical protein J5842_04395, partial [Lachnospiraceae bacterium]|nr:hypothetical protein [Lachnospiraceae bacterium]